MQPSPPLTEVINYILLSHSPGAKHGYVIMQDVQELSQGRVVLSTGTLYGALKRLDSLLHAAKLRAVEGSSKNPQR